MILELAKSNVFKKKLQINSSPTLAQPIFDEYVKKYSQLYAKQLEANMFKQEIIELIKNKVSYEV